MLKKGDILKTKKGKSFEIKDIKFEGVKGKRIVYFLDDYIYRADFEVDVDRKLIDELITTYDQLPKSKKVHYRARANRQTTVNNNS